MTSRWVTLPLLGAAIVLQAGCSNGPRRAVPPAYSSEAGAAAIAVYDANGDGVISGRELDRVPALRASLHQCDHDGDQRLTAEEIDRRIDSWKKSRIAEMPVRCRVLLDGTPLANAQVVFDPEPFLGPDVKSARGVTADDGIAGMSLPKEYLADPRYAGVACGWYTIRVTSNNREIPERYHAKSKLGCEVAMDAHWVGVGEVLVELTMDQATQNAARKE